MHRVKKITPHAYDRATKANGPRVANGCGPSTRYGILARLIPDHLLGLDVEAECNVHDWMYYHGKTPADKIAADNLFFRNLQATVRDEGGPLMLPRLALARVAYFVVRNFGGRAFHAKGEGRG